MRNNLLFRACLLLLFASTAQAEWSFRAPMAEHWHWVASPPVAFMPQIGKPTSAGGGGSVTLVSGTTAISGGADTQVCFNDAATLSCGDAGMVYNKTTDTLTLAGSVVGPAGSAAATAFNFGTAGTGFYSTSATIKAAVGGGDKVWVDGTNAYFFVPATPSAASGQSLGTSALPWLNARYTGWAIGTQGEIATNADYTNATASFTSTLLSVSVTSGQTYAFSMHLTFADSTAADGAQFDFNGGAATMTNFRAHCFATNNVGAVLAITNAATTSIATAVQVALALTTQADITCQGSFVPSSTNTFIIRAAQTAHSTGTLTVHRGSFLSVRDARPL